MVNSRTKGMVGENEARKYLERLGYIAKRRVRNYKTEDDLILDHHPQVSIEVKYGVVKRVKVGGKAGKTAVTINDKKAEDWREQAVKAMEARGATAVLVMYCPYKSNRWYFGYYNPFGVWCWSTGEDRHKVILGCLISESEGEA